MMCNTMGCPNFDNPSNLCGECTLRISELEAENAMLRESADWDVVNAVQEIYDSREKIADLEAELAELNAQSDEAEEAFAGMVRMNNAALDKIAELQEEATHYASIIEELATRVCRGIYGAVFPDMVQTIIETVTGEVE